MHRRYDEHGNENDSGNDRLLANLWYEIRIKECQTSPCQHLGFLIVFWRTLKEQRVTCIENHFARLLVYAMSLSCHGNEHHIRTLLKLILAHLRSNQVTSKSYVSRAKFSMSVNLVDAKHVMVGCYQAMRVFQFQYLADLSRVNQTVASENKFVFVNGRNDLLVEPDDFN